MTVAKKTISSDTKETNEVAKARQNRPESAKKPMARMGQTKEFTFKDSDGKETAYTFQFPGLRAAEELRDGSRMANGVVAASRYNEELMKQVIVDPKTDWNYWDEHEGYGEVMDQADSFLGGLLYK
ncbi:hypothetical protein [Lactiplantibacillus xiangfangensis]|uniref:hypothetical protein n=1 Tax=Lactiplantibacillus xiangfangensis TaxID=942150 RepID=UPI00384C7A25